MKCLQITFDGGGVNNDNAKARLKWPKLRRITTNAKQRGCRMDLSLAPLLLREHCAHEMRTDDTIIRDVVRRRPTGKADGGDQMKNVWKTNFQRAEFASAATRLCLRS